MHDIISFLGKERGEHSIHKNIPIAKAREFQFLINIKLIFRCLTDSIFSEN